MYVHTVRAGVLSVYFWHCLRSCLRLSVWLCLSMFASLVVCLHVVWDFVGQQVGVGIALRRLGRIKGV